RNQVLRADPAHYEVVVREWLNLNKGKWTPHHYGDVEHRLKIEVFPHIGRKPVGTITRADCIAVVHEILPRSVDLAHRCKRRMKAIFDYAIAMEYGIAINPCDKMEKAMPEKQADGYRPAIRKLKPLREMLDVLESFPASPVIKAANRFMALTAMRPGEVLMARWDQIHLDGTDEYQGAVWLVPERHMKMKRPHVV